MQKSTSEADYYNSCAHSTGIRQHLVLEYRLWEFDGRSGFRAHELAGRGTEIGDWASCSRFKVISLQVGRGDTISLKRDLVMSLRDGRNRLQFVGGE